MALWGGLEAGGAGLGTHGNLICLKNGLISFIREVLDFFPRRSYFSLQMGNMAYIQFADNSLMIVLVPSSLNSTVH